MESLVFGVKKKVAMPDIGLGTWRIGGSFTPDSSHDAADIASINKAIGMGYRLIDTAEMYGGGHSEELVGIAAADSDVFIATKVWQTNLRYDDLLSAARRSLKRLKRKHVDLYQIHWPSDDIPLRETMKAMEKLADDGVITHIGVSNFGVELLEDARSYLSRHDIFSDQVSYSVAHREPENGLTEYCRKHGIGIIAYEPLAKGKVFEGRVGRVLAEASEMVARTRSQVALNWLMCKHALPIPKSIDFNHLAENFGASGWRLPAKVLKFIDDSLRQ